MEFGTRLEDRLVMAVSDTERHQLMVLDDDVGLLGQRPW